MGNSKSKGEGGRMKDKGIIDAVIDSPSSFILQPSSFVNPLTQRTKSALASLGVSSDAKLLVAVSGGPDSLVLAHVLQSLRGTGAFAAVTVAHVNHGLRKTDADEEENAIKRYCERWKVPIEVKHVNILGAVQREKTGIEETARKQRYECFEELAKTHGFDFVLTAHTANDQAETVLMHLVRGAGVRGLAGIPPKRKLGTAYLLRPWLDVTKNEIFDYIEEFHLVPMQDTSNDDLSYQRNRVRHKIIPAMAEAWPDRSPVKAIAGLAERMRELSTFLDTLTGEKLGELRLDEGLSMEALKNLRGFMLHAVMETHIANTIGPFSLTALQTRRMEDWLASNSKAMELHCGVHLTKENKVLRVEKDKESFAFNPSFLVPGKPLKTPYGAFNIVHVKNQEISKDPFHARFDESDLGENPIIRVRPWGTADRMAPFGMEGKRKLISDLLTEAGVTGERRKHYPVVELNGQILWLPGVRRSDCAPISAGTQSLLEFSFKPSYSNGTTQQ